MVRVRQPEGLLIKRLKPVKDTMVHCSIPHAQLKWRPFPMFVWWLWLKKLVPKWNPGTKILSHTLVQTLVNLKGFQSFSSRSMGWDFLLDFNQSRQPPLKNMTAFFPFV